MMRHIVLSHAMFDSSALLTELGKTGAGAVASFIGHVREGGDNGHPLVALELQHYPEKTEAALADIADHMAERWALDGIAIHHRIGRIEIGEPIVFVAAASRHRAEALEAVDYAMDAVKQGAFLWKKEHRGDGSAAWVEARHSDSERAARWDDQ